MKEKFFGKDRVRILNSIEVGREAMPYISLAQSTYTPLVMVHTDTPPAEGGNVSSLLVEGCYQVFH